MLHIRWIHYSYENYYVDQELVRAFHIDTPHAEASYQPNVPLYQPWCLVCNSYGRTLKHKIKALNKVKARGQRENEPLFYSVCISTGCTVANMPSSNKLIRVYYWPLIIVNHLSPSSHANELGILILKMILKQENGSINCIVMSHLCKLFNNGLHPGKKNEKNANGQFDFCSR
ncbi:hypothetical protein AGLY_001003 [Aphis glycines]|uniref:Uncharacterized protein n=1 Tax=Aphis glycines TaxID=307491 RepID=A0A6G0U9M7_APHGL|nr:hypothetical protein AGLY_001003 [Aphis glycines]